jgi:NADH:ubiquinone oxidoreductase subunit 6 (subunit J)
MMGYLKAGNEMTETSTSRTTGARFSAAPVPLILRLLTYAGAVGTLILVLVGFLAGIGRLWQRDALEELVVIVPLWVLIGGWMLSG